MSAESPINLDEIYNIVTTIRCSDEIQAIDNQIRDIDNSGHTQFDIGALPMIHAIRRVSDEISLAFGHLSDSCERCIFRILDSAINE